MKLVSYMAPGFPESLFEKLAREIGAEVHFERDRSGPAADDDPFRDHRFDLGWICSTSFVDLATRAEHPSVQLTGVAWAPEDPDVESRPVYFGDLVVRADSRVARLADLRGGRIAGNDVVSLSGHHALRFAIVDAGLDPDTFAEVTFTGGHHNSLDAVIAGEVDAAVVDSVVRITRARHDGAVAALRVVDRLGPWPVQPLVARADLPAGEVDRVRRRLLAVSENPDVAEELHAAGLSNLVEVDADHYSPVRRAMERISI